MAKIDNDSTADKLTGQFARDGYLLVRGLCPPEQCLDLRRRALRHLDPLLGPVEYEADLGYPGAPASFDKLGGDTPRRLLHACSRDALFLDWAIGPALSGYLRRLFGRDDICLSQCHHNCVMTKHPGYSSATLWHQDVRYWSFKRPDLISVWLALGRETGRNGALQLIPGSHLMDIGGDRLDQALFLRPDLALNQALIRQAETVHLEPGDVLFFDCRTFHAAGSNLTDRTKLSLVFTYHAADNQPVAGTRSARLPAIPLHPVPVTG